MIHKAKKSLGQNFLKSIPALNKIVEAGEISKDDIILEIGPGKGVLTEKLLFAISASHKESDREKTGCVIAIEKDRALYELLQEKFANQIKLGNLVLVHGDILDLDPLLISPFEGGEKYKIIANIPYNITGAILKKFLGDINQPISMVLMVQNEVAKRICVNNNPASLKLRRAKESILSISVKAYGEPKMILKVPARYFSPAPKVDSAIITIKNISRKNFTSPLNPSPYKGEGKILDEKLFWEIIHAGFAHKRKKLSSNLKKYDLLFGGGIASAGLGNKRAEELTLKDWIELVKMIQYKYKNEF